MSGGSKSIAAVSALQYEPVPQAVVIMWNSACDAATSSMGAQSPKASSKDTPSGRVTCSRMPETGWPPVSRSMISVVQAPAEIGSTRSVNATGLWPGPSVRVGLAVAVAVVVRVAVGVAVTVGVSVAVLVGFGV